MYSGTTFRQGSGNILGVHQKIDKIARRKLGKIIPKSLKFPNTKEILSFEGHRGPDSIKLMGTPYEPWHFINPTQPGDHALVVMINDHIHNLAEALRDKNRIRASFESAWLAHAVVDGLTPAHHFPLGDKIEELWGKPRLERLSIKEKHIVIGANRRDTLSKNWQWWGAGGVILTHFLFEWGIATTIFPERFKKSGVSKDDVKRLKKEGFEVLFMESVHKIYEMKMYDTFCKKGWTRRLASDSKKVLIPEIIKTVTLAWYQAIIMAESK